MVATRFSEDKTTYSYLSSIPSGVPAQGCESVHASRQPGEHPIGKGGPKRSHHTKGSGQVVVLVSVAPTIASFTLGWAPHSWVATKAVPR